jgi:hypothetical protein
MMVVSANSGAFCSRRQPKLLWVADYMRGLSSSWGFRGTTTKSCDISPDRKRFLLIKDEDDKLFATKIVVSEELKRPARSSI